MCVNELAGILLELIYCFVFKFLPRLQVSPFVNSAVFKSWVLTFVGCLLNANEAKNIKQENIALGYWKKNPKIDVNYANFF